LLGTKSSAYLAKDQWIPNSLNLKPPVMPCNGWGQLEGYHNKRRPKPKTIVELQETLQMIWDSLPQGPIDKSLKKFPK